MKNFLIPLLSLMLPAAAITAEDAMFDGKPVDLEVLIFGKSYHTNRTVHWNETNPGAGIGVALEADPHIDLTFDAGVYEDSYTRQATFVMPGIRGIIGNRHKLHCSIGLSLGYINGSGQCGLGEIPYISIGYSKVDLCITGDPFMHDSNDRKKADGTYDINYSKTKFIAAFLRIRVLTF